MAEPRIVTVDGRNAIFEATGTYKVKIELAPVDRGDGALLLHWGAQSTLAVPGQIGAHTRAKEFGVQLATELKYGQTVLAQVRPWQNDSGEVPGNQTEAIVMLVTPTLVSPADLVAPEPLPSAAARPRPIDLLDPPAVDDPHPAMRRRATAR